MAGSYAHCVGLDGKFCFDLIDNMSDAHEACKMMFGMIQILAERIGDEYNVIEAAELEYYKRERT
jgi:hypothetical protein